MMDEKQLLTLHNIAAHLFSNNYDYYWLKSTIAATDTIPEGEGTLITGSSHALNGIWEGAWNHARNCSMHSQDIYYDFLCAKNCVPSGKFNKCFIVLGYYIAYQDLSKSTAAMETVLSRVYEPLFKDTHHWKNPNPVYDPWDDIAEAGDFMKEVCEKYIAELMQNSNTYYNENYRQRGTLFDFGGRAWAEIPADERMEYGRLRTVDHNKFINYKASFEENLTLFNDYINFLHEYDVTPIVVVTPFSEEYNHFVDLNMKQGLLALLEHADKDVHFVDFNEADYFDSSDFMDTDHLNLQGAKKVSSLLSDMFGA